MEKDRLQKGRIMKHLSKFLSAALVMALAVVMALALAPSAALAASHTITIKEPSGNQASHEYAAYQVFTGTYDSNSKQLEGIVWGSGVDGNALLTGLKADTTIGHYFKDATDAPTAAAAMADMKSGSTDAEALAKVVAEHLTTTKYSTVVNNKESDEITVDADGYYFVKDVTDNLSNGDTYSRFMLQVAGGDVEVEAKDTTTTSNKHVKETNDSVKDTIEEQAGWRNVGDYDMGDMVPFQLTGQVAADYDYYDSYYFAFEDTYDKNQLGEAEDVNVFVDGTQLTEAQLKAAGYKLTQKEGSFTIEFTDLKKIVDADHKPLVHAGAVISVEYKAKLLTGANIGSTGNVNTSHTVFSNNPNYKDSRGKTPDHKVKVFTYQLVVNKVNEAQNPLKGADFTLSKLDKTDGQYKPVPTKVDGVELKTVSEDGATFTFKGLDEGVYKLEETTTPKGYNTISPIEFSIISATNDDTGTLVSINGSTESTSKGKAEFSDDKDTGTVSTTIQNKSGSILPSTGGMGTTVLYVGGAALVVVAVIGLAKRRAARSDA
ncbi:SpaA isopeptide-forming pilin-related protein [Olsenella absiana]